MQLVHNSDDSKDICALCKAKAMKARRTKSRLLCAVLDLLSSKRSGRYDCYLYGAVQCSWMCSTTGAAVRSRPTQSIGKAKRLLSLLERQANVTSQGVRGGGEPRNSTHQKWRHHRHRRLTDLKSDGQTKIKIRMHWVERVKKIRVPLVRKTGQLGGNFASCVRYQLVQLRKTCCHR